MTTKHYQTHFLVVDFTKDKSGWTGTRIIFDISTVHGQTKLTFTHAGLVPGLECYGICSDAWTNYIGGSLEALVETGTGRPNPYIPAIENAEAMKGGNHE